MLADALFCVLECFADLNSTLVSFLAIYVYSWISVYKHHIPTSSAYEERIGYNKPKVLHDPS